MMVGRHIGIKAFGAPEYLNDVYDTDFSKGQKRAVDRVEGDVREFSFHDLKNVIGRGVGVQT
jgi:hypothetical protein